MKLFVLRLTLAFAAIVSAFACSDSEMKTEDTNENPNERVDTSAVTAENLRAYFENLLGPWELVSGSTKEFDENGTLTNSSVDTAYRVEVTKSSENVYNFMESFCTQAHCGDSHGSFRIDGNVLTVLIERNAVIQPSIEGSSRTTLTYTYLYEQVHLKEAEQLEENGEWVRRSEYRRMNGARGESILRLKRAITAQ